MVRHPLRYLSHQNLKRMAWLALAATLLAGAGMISLDMPLRNAVCTDGIISLELAFSNSRVHEIFASWDTSTRLIAALGLGFDYLFLVCYSTLLGSLALLMGGTDGRGRKVGTVMAWAATSAAMLDGIENAALARLLLGDSGSYLGPLAGWAASVKFALIALVLGFLALRLLQNRRTASGSDKTFIT